MCPRVSIVHDTPEPVDGRRWEPPADAVYAVNREAPFRRGFSPLAAANRPFLVDPVGDTGTHPREGKN
jgi:hypothetical protein